LQQEHDMKMQRTMSAGVGTGVRTWGAGSAAGVMAVLLAAGGAWAVDEPATAPTLTEFGTISGSTFSATPSATNIPGCSAAQGSRDVWIRLTSPATASIIVGLCATTTSWDSVVQVFASETETSEPGAMIACSNGGCISEAGHASVRVDVEAGKNYLIRVVGATTAANGGFFLSVGPGVLNEPLVRAEGTDAIIGQISDALGLGWVTVNNEVIRSFAWGTRTWNVGNRPMRWTSSTSDHPVIGTNLYRVTGNKFEQIGAGWVKHGFAGRARSAVRAARWGSTARTRMVRGSTAVSRGWGRGLI
jgi:hypothetical protein